MKEKNWQPGDMTALYIFEHPAALWMNEAPLAGVSARI